MYRPSCLGIVVTRAEAHAGKEVRIKLNVELAVLRRRVAMALHLDDWKEVLAGNLEDDASNDRDWVIVYRTAHGYCCLYHGKPVEFDELSDVQSWSAEMDVRTYFMGL
uniref:hypothetical protein n=1 Tax=Burkholderia anthina TaxID=179879 RepID=UPI001FC7EE9F|nr:hypothetical protein [Burkholderia anthina]